MLPLTSAFSVPVIVDRLKHAGGLEAWAVRGMSSFHEPFTEAPQRLFTGVTFASCVSGALASLWFVSYAASPSAVRADASLVRDAGIGFVRVAGCHRAA